jgi:tetratricopeptide (TPR) repeat protein
LEDRLQDAGTAYTAGNWEEAIIHYKAYLAFSQDKDLATIEDRLFESYIQIIEAILAEDHFELEDLKYAGKLLQDARKLHPQNAEAQLARAISENEIRDLLVGKYILLARTTLYDSPNSTEAMFEAKQYLSTALGLNPHSPAIFQELDLLSRYLKALSSYDKDQWTDVIVDVRYIYEKDQDFANGAANQFLYEAYSSRGAFWVAVGNFTSAVEDYQQATLIAYNYPDAILLNYEAQLNLAFAIGRTGNYKDAANLYKAAIDQADVKLLAYSMDRILYIAITAAETNLRLRKYETSYYFFADAIEGKKEVFTLSNYTFKEGDHIIFLAKEFNSTVSMILEYSDLVYTDLIKPGQELLIPTLP